MTFKLNHGISLVGNECYALSPMKHLENILYTNAKERACFHDNRFGFTFCFIVRPGNQISPADETVLPEISDIDRFIKVIR